MKNKRKDLLREWAKTDKVGDNLFQAREDGFREGWNAAIQYILRIDNDDHS